MPTGNKRKTIFHKEKKMKKANLLLFCVGIIIVSTFSGCLTNKNVVSSSPNISNNQIPNLPDESVESFEFTVVGNIPNQKITIDKYTGSSLAIKIPSKINDIPVTSIGTQAFITNINIHTIIIPEGITYIGDNAFNLSPNSDSLITIIIPETIKYIDTDTFWINSDGRPLIVADYRNGNYNISVKIIIGENVRFSRDIHPERTFLGDPRRSVGIVFFEEFYINNGRKAGIYTIQKNKSNANSNNYGWMYSVK